MGTLEAIRIGATASFLFCWFMAAKGAISVGRRERDPWPVIAIVVVALPFFLIFALVRHGVTRVIARLSR